MKLKLARSVMSHALRFLQPEAREYEAMATLIRRASLGAAGRCSKLGSDTDRQFQQSLTEFLAFFCVIAINEMAIRSGRQSDDELKNLYQNLLRSICEGPGQTTVRDFITQKNGAFDHWFYGYWNADFEGMRISARDLEELEQKKISGRTGGHCLDAALILLVRIARLESPDLVIPETPRILEYDRAIQQSVALFVRSLADVFRNPDMGIA